jgi:mycofactocin precursor
MSNSTAQAPISDTETITQSVTQTASQTADVSLQQPAIEAEMLIEEISIDGMCGVY